MPIQTVLLWLAILFFLFDGFHVSSPRVSWTPLAWACFVAVVGIEIGKLWL